MKRFILFKNGKAIGDYNSERVARARFLKACESCDFHSDAISLNDLDKDGESIANY